MANDPKPSPEDLLARGDPGDETANRYRFQWTWAAVVCCMLLDGTEDVQEVFCEHHEDVLLKHRDGSFTGHQVKTRRTTNRHGRRTTKLFLRHVSDLLSLNLSIPVSSAASTF